jgi:hypothetical protein
MNDEKLRKINEIKETFELKIKLINERINQLELHKQDMACQRDKDILSIDNNYSNYESLK